jgi:hypothetical protein
MGIDRSELRWPSAWLWGSAIVAYFVVMVILFPNWVLGRGFMEEASGLVADLVILVVLGVPLVALLYGLRVLQRTGRI